jgi:quercetin dioxygenase-like cupin family protein
MEPMPTMPRCVVTGHDASGNSVFTSDEPVPAAHTTPGGTLFYELWATDAAPAPINASPVNASPVNASPVNASPVNAGPVNAGPGGAGPGGAAAPDPAGGPPRVAPAPNGTTLRINEMPPGASSPMHRTQTVDYGIVLGGEVVLVLDDSETVLRAGDVVVQRGTSHRWENRSDAPARVAFILIDGAFA